MKANILAGLIDEVHTLRAKRLKAEKRIAEQKAEEDALRARIAEAFREADLNEFQGDTGRCYFKRTVVGTVVDEKAFLAWAKGKNANVLKVGVNGDEYRARLAAGVEVPGVEQFIREDLTIGEAK